MGKPATRQESRLPNGRFRVRSLKKQILRFAQNDKLVRLKRNRPSPYNPSSPDFFCGVLIVYSNRRMAGNANLAAGHELARRPRYCDALDGLAPPRADLRRVA